MLRQEPGAIRRKAAALTLVPRYRFANAIAKQFSRDCLLQRNRISLRRTSDQAPEREYWFKPVEEWLPAPVVRIKDIRTKKVIEFPKIQDTDETGIEPQLTSNDGVVRNKDYRETDTNNHVVVNKLISAIRSVEMSRNA